MNKIEAIEAFIAVVDTGNFSKAAGELKISRPAVSKFIRQLEDHLQARLLTRTTRQVHLTELGRIYYDRTKTILNELDNADHEISQIRSEARGALKITAPTNFGSDQLGPVIAQFLEKYPQITVELSLNDHTFDMIGAGFDLAIRVGKQPDSSLIMRKITEKRRVLCASNEYLEKYGAPIEPKDLFEHTCLCSNLVSTPDEWHLFNGGEEFRVKVKSALITSNAEVLRQAVIQSLGIAQGPAFVFSELAHEGTIQPLLPNYNLAPAEIFALYPIARHVAPKVRVFIEFLVDYFEKHDEPDYAI